MNTHKVVYIRHLSCCFDVHVHCIYIQDPNVRLIRELKAEIKRLKMIIEDGNLVGHLHVLTYIIMCNVYM